MRHLKAYTLFNTSVDHLERLLLEEIGNGKSALSVIDLFKGGHLLYCIHYKSNLFIKNHSWLLLRYWHTWTIVIGQPGFTATQKGSAYFVVVKISQATIHSSQLHFCYFVHIKLTCAVWSCSRPCSICEALACGRASEEVVLHTRVHDGVGEGCAVHARNKPVSRCGWIPTLYRCNTGARREEARLGM